MATNPPRPNRTPIVRCPRCEHQIDDHVGFESPSCGVGCSRADCDCRVTPNTIAVAAINTAMFGDLTEPTPTRISRQPDGSWA
jgi:hypothetical protein